MLHRIVQPCITALAIKFRRLAPLTWGVSGKSEIIVLGDVYTREEPMGDEENTVKKTSGLFNYKFSRWQSPRGCVAREIVEELDHLMPEFMNSPVSQITHPPLSDPPPP